MDSVSNETWCNILEWSSVVSWASFHAVRVTFPTESMLNGTCRHILFNHRLSQNNIDFVFFTPGGNAILGVGYATVSTSSAHHMMQPFTRCFTISSDTQGLYVLLIYVVVGVCRFVCSFIYSVIWLFRYLKTILPLSHKSGELWACNCLRTYTFPIL